MIRVKGVVHVIKLPIAFVPVSILSQFAADVATLDTTSGLFSGKLIDIKKDKNNVFDEFYNKYINII